MAPGRNLGWSLSFWHEAFGGASHGNKPLQDGFQETGTWISEPCGGSGVQANALAWEFLSDTAITGYFIKFSRNGLSHSSRAPMDWEIQGSTASWCNSLTAPNIDTDWVTLDSQTGQVAWADQEIRRFSLTGTTSYKCYRFKVTQDNYNTGNVHCVCIDYLGFEHPGGSVSPSTLSPITSSPIAPTTSPTVVNRSPYFEVLERSCTNSSTGQAISCPSMEDARKVCESHGQELCSKPDAQSVLSSCAHCFFYRDSSAAYFNCAGHPNTCNSALVRASCCTYASVRFERPQPPQHEHLLAWYKFEGNFNDSSNGTGQLYPGYGVGVASTPRTAGSVDSRALRVESNVTNDIYSTPTRGYARFPNGPQPENGVTVAAWVKSAVPGMYPGMLQLVSKYTAYILGSASTNSRNICFAVYRSDGQWVDSACAMVDTRETTNWNHFVGTFNVTTGRSVFYLNGQVTQIVDSTPPLALFVDTGPLEIGQREGRDHGDFNGWIDDVMIYDYALSTAEVHELFVSYKAVTVTRVPTTASPYSNAPSSSPSSMPSSAPLYSPSVTPSSSPHSNAPSIAPSSSPHSNAPSSAPSCCPSITPSSSPHSNAPSSAPSCCPSITPSSSPQSNAPSSTPSMTPSSSPHSNAPSSAPSCRPSIAPFSSSQSNAPSSTPSMTPSSSPHSNAPSSAPSCCPSMTPSSSPHSNAPSSAPSMTPSSSPSSTPLTYTSSPATSVPTATPITAAPVTAAPATLAPRTAAPTTASPVTAAPATISPSAVALEVLRDCIQIKGPSSGWAHATLTFRAEALCKAYPVSSMWWRYDPDGSPPISTSSQLTMKSRNLTALLGGQPSHELWIHACALFNETQITVCKAQAATIYHRPSPAITVEAPEPFRPGAGAWVRAHIRHPDPRNITAQQRASFSYKWTLRAKSRDGVVHSVPWPAAMAGGAIATTRRDLYLPPGTLTASREYTFRFEADMRSAYGDERPYFAVNLTLQTLASPLVAVIRGGASRDVRAGESYQLDGSGSYDPDYAQGEATWLWTCERRTAGSSSWVPCPFGLSSPLSSQPVLDASLMQSGHTLRLSMNYSVSTEWISRTSTASAMLQVRPGAVPDVALREHPSVLSVSRNLEITVDAYSSSAALRGGEMVYNWSVVASPGGGAKVGVEIPSRATLQIQASKLGEGAFTFTVGVTDVLAGTAAAASTSVVIASVPKITSLTVTPPTGIAYSQSFQLEAAASADLLPLRYQFAYRLKQSSPPLLLSSFSSSNLLTLTLPAGNLTILTMVRDSIGGEASRSIRSVIVTTSVFNDDAGESEGSLDPVAQKQLECNRTHAAVAKLRAVIDSSSTLPPSRSSRLHVSDAVTEMLLALELEERFTDALRTIDYSLDIVSMQQCARTPLPSDNAFENIGVIALVARPIPWESLVEISSCEGDLAAIVEGQSAGDSVTSGTATTTTTTIADLSSSIWAALDTKMNALAASPAVISGAGAQGAQTLAELTASPSANVSARSIERLANTTGLLLEAADAEELFPTSQRGKNTAQTLSNLLSLSSYSLDAADNDEARQAAVRSKHAASVQAASETPPAPASSSAECQAVNGVLDLFDRLLQLASNAIPPEGDPVSYDTSNFQAGASKAFADSSAHATVGNTTVVVPALTQSSSSSLARQEQRITISSIAANVSAVRLCRPAAVASQSGDRRNGKGRMLSGINSVNLYTRNASSSSSSSGGGSGNNGSSTEARRSSDVRVRAFAPGQSVSIEFPLNDGSAAARENAGCYFWDPAISRFSDEGCRLNWTRAPTNAAEAAAAHSSRNAVCVCSHLTEFAVVAYHRENRQSDSPDEKGEPSRLGYVYVMSSVVYIVVGCFASYQVWRLYRAKKINLGEWRTLLHVAVIATSVLRVVSSLLLSGIAESFSAADDVHPAFLLVLLAIPYSIIFWVFSYPAFQWLSVVHNNKLSKNPFQRVKIPYIIVNISGMALAWSLFGYFSFTISNPLYPSMCVALVYAALTCSIMFYGLRISKMMLGVGATELDKRKKAALKFRSRPMATTGCHFLQGATYALASIFYKQHMTLLILTAVYYMGEVIALCVLLKLYWKTINKVVTSSQASRRRGGKKISIGSMNSVGTSTSSRFQLDSRGSIALGDMESKGSRNGSYDSNSKRASRPWRPSSNIVKSNRSGLESALPSYHGRLGLISTRGIKMRETLTSSGQLDLIGSDTSFETIPTDEKQQLGEKSVTGEGSGRNIRIHQPLSDIKESSIDHSISGAREVSSVAFGDSIAL
eukprot:jgi/Bigna1/76303/fgenesh1_pg.40_\